MPQMNRGCEFLIVILVAVATMVLVEGLIFVASWLGGQR